MLLKREWEEDLVLYDDHGDAWKVTFESADDRPPMVETGVAGAISARVIAFRCADGEPLRVLYEGTATDEEELVFDEVVVHFLKARD